MQLRVVNADSRIRRLVMRKYAESFKGKGATYYEEGDTMYCDIPLEYNELNLSRFLSPATQREVAELARVGIQVQLIKDKDKVE